MPLNSRVLNSRQQQFHAPSKIPIAGAKSQPHNRSVLNRPPKYKPYDQQTLSRAVEAVISKKMSLRQASEHYAIPRATIGDRLTGRVCPGAVSGPSPYLTHEEEDELVSFLIRCAT